MDGQTWTIDTSEGIPLVRVIVEVANPLDSSVIDDLKNGIGEGMKKIRAELLS